MDEECSMFGKRNTYSMLVGTSYWKEKLKWIVKKRGMRVWNGDHGQERVKSVSCSLANHKCDKHDMMTRILYPLDFILQTVKEKIVAVLSA
jgi:hypothetical protein